jgi:hypothetical protein
MGDELTTERTRPFELAQAVRCLECRSVYPIQVSETARANPGCPECGYVGWIATPAAPAEPALVTDPA